VAVRLFQALPLGTDAVEDDIDTHTIGGVVADLSFDICVLLQDGIGSKFQKTGIPSKRCRQSYDGIGTGGFC
jgi:hypothetical protein